MVRLVAKLIQVKAEYGIDPAPGRTGAAEGRKQVQGSVTQVGVSLEESYRLWFTFTIKKNN